MKEKIDQFDRYDTENLKKAKKLLEEVYSYNYNCDKSRKERKLSTIMRKLEALIEEHGAKD